jgi:hypothetical protein
VFLFTAFVHKNVDGHDDVHVHEHEHVRNGWTKVTKGEKSLESKRFMLRNKVSFGYLEQVKRSKCAV